MRYAPDADEIRQLVVETLQDLGAAIYDWSDLDETILIDAGKYMARSYRADGFMAMWLIDVGILQFYDEDGNMVRTINLLLERAPQRMAA